MNSLDNNKCANAGDPRPRITAPPARSLPFPPAPDMHVIIEEVQNGYLVKVYTNIFEMQSGAEPREKFVSLDIDHMLCGLTQIYQEHEKAKTKHKIKIKEYEAKKAEKRI